MITLTGEQLSAAKLIKDWFQRCTGTQQVFRLFGGAGTGKSTILRHVLDDLGLQPHLPVKPGVVTATFTGKAAMVLVRMGTQAQTIHSLIYRVIEESEDAIDAAEAQLARAVADLEAVPPDRRMISEARVERMRQDISKMKRPSYVINPESDASECKLIVLDEVSMVSDDMAADLLSFGKPVLVLGDPGQLPPIRGEGYFTQVKPDVLLSEIHRQAWDSPIIRLASMARSGEEIPFGKHGATVVKLHRSKLDPERMLRPECQVICGYNATRRKLNNDLRGVAGYVGELPSSSDDRVICLKNQHDDGLINGMFLSLGDVREEDDLIFSATITDDLGVPIGSVDARGRQQRHEIYRGHFDDHVKFDADRRDKDWKHLRGLVEATFGWAITCHKAQGSQWRNVIVWDDGFGGNPADRRRWLYTAITRAQEGLVIAA